MTVVLALIGIAAIVACGALLRAWVIRHGAPPMDNPYEDGEA